MASSHNGRFDNDDTMANDEFDLRLDELLRREFARSFSEEEEPKRVLAGMAPAIRRAHRIHRVKQAAVGTAAVLALAAGGLGLMARSSPTDEAQLTVAGESESPPVNPDLEQELVVTGTTARSTSDRGNRGGQRDDGANTSATPTTATTPETRTSTTEPSGSTRPTTETAVSSTVTTASNTSVAPDGTVTIDSACGSIVVARSGNMVELRDVNPDPGLGVDIKNSGPEKVEVGFEGGSKHCELKVTVEAGELKVDNDGNGGDDEHDGGESEHDN